MVLPRALGRSFASPMLLATALGVSIAGCASPSIVVRSVDVRETSAEATRLDVAVDLTNPADDSMRLLQWNYTFAGASGSYSGTWEALVTLPPNSTVSRTIPVVLPGPNAAAEDWSISGSLSYRSPSRVAEIFYDLGIWRPRTGFGGSPGSAPAADSTAAGTPSAAASQ